MKSYVDDNYISILKKAKINEAIYNLNFDYNYYIPYLSGLNGSVNLFGVSISDIENLNSILQLFIPNLRFKTRTSLELNGFSAHSVSIKQKVIHLLWVHDTLTQAIIWKEISPTFHIGIPDEKNGILTFKDANNFEELLFNIGMIIGRFKKLDHNSNNGQPTNEILKTSAESNSSLNVDVIRKNCSKYGKNLLKILEKMDPRLFGPRKVGKNSRSFSGLCQKQQQRVVPITREEYDYLHKIVPDSVANLQNQSYNDQRVYLFCPFKKYPFLNYHVFPHQLCIVRCTTKPSNKTQYNFCAQSLGAEHTSNIQNRYENQTVTLYNPLITKGRKCKLPDEFKMILIDCVLLKLPITEGISKFCLDTYGKFPFIIQRDPVNARYIILIEYNKEVDYVLLIQAEMNGGFFIVINEKTLEPLTFSKSPEILKFFVNNIRKTNSQYNFFNYLEKVFNVKLSDKYELQIREILDYVHELLNISYIVQKEYILGVICKNKLVMTPALYWRFDTDTNTVPLFIAIGRALKGELKFPNISELDERHVTTLYRDYITNKISMVTFAGVSVWVEPCELSAKWATHDVITFDAHAMILTLYNVNIERDRKFKESQIQILDIAEVLRNYVYIYLMENDNIDVEAILKTLKELGIVYDKTTFIDYVDKKAKTSVSWRTSKINEQDFKNYFEKYADLSDNEIIKTIYQKFQDELAFRPIKDEAISSKIITI